MRLFERLRSTKMPLRDMKRYVALAQQGDNTFAARREMLELHAARLDAQQSKIDACRTLITEKIETYSTLEQDQVD